MTIAGPSTRFATASMLAGGHNIPTAYALWMIMGEAMAEKHAATSDDRYAVDPNVGMLAIDALGFRRGRGALATLLQDNGLENHPLFAQAKIRGIRSLAGHAETTDLTNDVNGGPSGIGVATASGKAAFWDFVGADDSLKVIALEGEFAMTEGACAGVEDPGDGAAGWQAAARDALVQQRRHRRFARRWRHSTRSSPRAT